MVAQTSAQADNMPSAEQGREVSCHSTYAFNANADTDSSKPFAFDSRAAAFNSVPQPLSKLNPSAQSFEPSLKLLANMPALQETAQASLTLENSKLNPLAAVFSPCMNSTQLSSLDSKTAAFPLVHMIESSASSPLASPFVSEHKDSQHTTLNPLAAAFFPNTTYHPSTHNALARVVSPSCYPFPNQKNPEHMDEVDEQYDSSASGPSETTDAQLEVCSWEELQFSRNGGPTQSTPDLSSDDNNDEDEVHDHGNSSFCSNASTVDEIEYNNQRSLLYQDPEIHHINWLGQGVTGKTSTPAAVSLAVTLMPAPARFVDEEDLRGKTVLREAMLTIDPVVFYGDLNEVKDLRGERLREAIIGSTAPYYTPFGWWQEDSYGEDDERPLIVEIGMTRYIEGTTIVNGWLDTTAPSRQDFFNDAQQSYYSMLDARKKGVRDRMLLGVGSTPLRSVLTADGLELNIAAKQQPSGDASGLITAIAIRCEDKTIAKSAVACTPLKDDGLFKNNSWADDLDDEDEVSVVRQATIPDDDLFKNAKWADDLDDEGVFVAVAGDDQEAATLPTHDPIVTGQPSVVLALPVSKELVVKQVKETLEPIETPACLENHKEVDDSATPIPNFSPVITGTGCFRFRPVVPISQEIKSLTRLEKIPVVSPFPPNSSAREALEPCSQAELEAEEMEMYGPSSGSTSTDSSDADESFASSSSSSSSSLKVRSKPAIADETGALGARTQNEIDEEDEFLFGQAPAVEALFKAEEGLTSRLFTLPIRGKHADSLMPNPLSLLVRTKPAESLVPRPLSFPIRTKRAESAPKTFDMPMRLTQVTEPVQDKTTAEYLAEAEELYAKVGEHLTPKTFENSQVFIGLQGEEEPEPDIRATSEPKEEWHELVAEDEDVRDAESVTLDKFALEAVSEDENVSLSPSTPARHILAEPTAPKAPSGSPPDPWDLCPAQVSPLSCKSGYGARQTRPVASGHATVATPKFNLVPASLQSMLTTDADRFAQKLGGIEEEEEELAQHNNLSDINGHFATTADEEEVAAKVDFAASMGHVILKRSPFCENLPAFVLAHAEDDNSSEPLTPERSPVPSPCKRQASNTPNAMLRKNVRFSLPYVDRDASSTEELVGTAGVGAIFEAEEAEVVDDSSILYGAMIYEADQLYMQSSFASHSFVALPDTGSGSGSHSLSDDIFTAPSTTVTAPTTVEGSEEGSPSPSLIPRPAKRPILLAEPVLPRDVPTRPLSVQTTTQNRNSSWPSIKSKFGRKPSDGFTDAANVQFTPTQRRTSLWSKVGNKLQKPWHLGASGEEKKKDGFRKAVKKVKNAFVNGFKALA